MKGRQRVTLRLSHDIAEQLDRASRVSGRPRNELIHNAIVHFLSNPEAAPANLNRIAQTTEFMQVALDLLVSRDMPEKRDAILYTVAQRMEQLHGA
jgi:uncharacterized protein (DUF1778 family)